MFTHLHCHSSHSLLDGLGNPSTWVETAVKKGFKALALTDHGSCSAALEFYKAAKAAGITPIVGCEFYVADDPFYRPPKGERMERYHLIVLAKNWRGLQSIFKQLTIANEQMYYRPLLSIDQIFKFEDCILTSACAAGLLKHPNYTHIIAKMKATYGIDFYLEIQPHWIDVQFEINNRAFSLSRLFDIKPVVANDAHYPREEDTLTHDVLLAIQTNANINDEGRFSFLNGDMAGLYLKTQSEMIHSFKPWIDGGYFDLEFLHAAFVSTQEIVYKCSNLDIPKLDFALPPLVTHEVEDEASFLVKLCNEGWKTKIAGRGLDEATYLKRLKHELGVVSKIGAIRYFLLGWDVINYAKKSKILCGFGRGSAGGSLIAYLLGITALDPIKHELYFERFLREDRIDMPDIDFDFAGDDRDKVIKYVKETYGEQNVCQISTSTVMHGKSAFRDVARVFSIPILQVNEISKKIDKDLNLEENFASGELAAFAETHPLIVKHAIRLDGQLRSKGIHAGGVVLSEDGFTYRGVLEKRKAASAINWHMGEVEHFGLLKFDFLGLSNLSVLGDTATLVRERTGIAIDYFSIEPNDAGVLKQFSDGHTAGFFQFESPGITGVCQKLAPIQTFETLVHINALYRPGPLDSGMVDSYVNRYHKKEEVSYLHEAETKITEQTLGLPIFQEQIMRQFVDLAGFTWPEADNMRKIISKSKGAALLEEKRKTFIDGCARTVGMAETVANTIYDNIVKFGRYGFNKAHAACYSYISYLTAWAKHYYPVEFMTALLRSVVSEAETTEKYIKEAERLGIKIEGPNINLSDTNWSAVGDRIVAGFASVKGVGSIAGEKIVVSRGRESFVSFEDFIKRTERRAVNKRVVESIAYAGGFESLVPNTKWIIDNYPMFVTHEGSPPEHVLVPSTDYDETEKYSQKAEYAPGVFSSSTIEIVADMTIDDDILTMLSGEHLTCQACPLATKDNHPVPWKWSTRNKVMMLGQFPNAGEEGKGEPFFGKAYTKMWQILKEEADITPGKVFQGHIFSCRPVSGRLQKEILDGCICPSLWLPKLVTACSPNVILAMGNAAAAAFTGQSSGIMKLNATSIWHGKYRAMVVFCITPGMMIYDESGEKEEMFREAIRKLKQYL